MKPRKPVFPPRQQDYPATRKRMLDKDCLAQFQFQQEDGSWHDLQTAISDRDVMTRIQADRYKRFPEERQRVLRIEVRVYLDEVIGDGDGETSGEELLARNEQITTDLIQRQQQQPSP